MNILFLGAENPSQTSRHRADALRRLGHVVSHLDPSAAFASRLRGNAARFHYHTGYVFLRDAVVNWLKSTSAATPKYDVCFVDGGEMLGSGAIDYLKTRCQKLILFNHDDPTGPRDWRRFRSLRSAIPHYDLCAVVRPFNVPEFHSLGAQKVIHVLRSYDELAHCPPLDNVSVPLDFRSEVTFIGGNIRREGRGEFLAELIKRGLNMSIWGDEWDRSRSWNVLAPHWRGNSLSGAAYVNAMRGAKICLGLLSKRNRDEHTTRSMEIPFSGGLLCAQRTTEHKALYEEGREAVFWSDADECISVCRSLLADEASRTQIKYAGMLRVRQNRVGNEDLCKKLLGCVA